MARYIDADALKLDIDMSQGARITDLALSVIRAVQNAPTADVVPKSEAERLQKERDEYKKHADNDIIYVHRIKAEVAMEIFEELERTIMHPNWASQNYKNWYFAELKKKYTGEQT